MALEVNAQYNIAKAGSLPARIAEHQRRKMYSAFLSVGVTVDDTILDVGVTGDQTYSHSNYLEAWYPSPERLTAAGVDADAAFLIRRYPGMEFILASGCRLPFKDGAFDFVHSSAVIEHVGNRSSQIAFIAEAYRVARKCVFVTTPNRWFPVEFHSLVPFLHWLPANTFRAILKRIGREFFAREENLNLLTAGDLRRMAHEVAGSQACRISGVRLGGWKSNLLLVLAKSS